MHLTFYVLFLSIAVALFHRSRAIQYLGLVLTSLLALQEKLMTLNALGSLLILAIALHFYYQHHELNKTIKTVLLILIVGLLSGFVLHHIPGFNIYLAINKLKISQALRAYTMPLNLDKVMAALILYTISNLIIAERSINIKALKQSALILLACVTVILGPALLSGYIRLDPKIPSILPIWSLNNFLFVCFSEEVIFRGFVQSAIQNYLPKSLKYVLLSIVLASTVFGLSHYKDGATFMALAGICGLFYGYAYFKTGRILCAILVHFFLNLIHILVFSYPS